MDRLLAARFDPAVVHVSRRRGLAVLACQPDRARPNVWLDVRPRHLAVAAAHLPRHIPALGRQPTDEFHLRGHAHPDRPGLRLFVFARLLLTARAVFGAGGASDRLLGSVRALSGAARLQLSGGRRPQRLAPSLLRLRGPLEQEQQPGLGVRPVVPQPLPARKTVHLQRRRLCHAQLHSHARHHDPRPNRRRLAQRQRLTLGKSARSS